MGVYCFVSDSLHVILSPEELKKIPVSGTPDC